MSKRSTNGEARQDRNRDCIPHCLNHITDARRTIALQFSADLDSIFGLHRPSARDLELEEKYSKKSDT